MNKALFASLLFLMLGTGKGWANNIAIANLTSVSSAGYVQLQFDLSWDNSWRNTTNYDAAWVFFKWKDNDGTWRHLSLTGTNISIGTGYTLTVPSDKTGVMIYRSSTAYGSAAITGIKVGVMNLPGNFDVKAFALEMVEMPGTDAFYAGDGESGTYYSNGNTGNPFLVNSASLTMGITAGQLDDGIANGTLVSGFPTGYNSSASIYMMKHEISQAAYRDFLNTLTYTQQTTRTAVAPNSAAGTYALGATSHRNGIAIATSGSALFSTTPAIYGCNLNGNGTYDESTDGEWIACGYLTWMDLCAFLDWAALRPMTELEFEKACRGTTYPVSGENAAGTTAAAAYTYTISNSGAANESATYSGSVLNGNFTYVSTSPGGISPLRVGIHATSNSTRISAGAGFYGALDLSGNINEQAITTSNAAGRSFNGNEGDGTLTAAGDANEDYWPGINGNITTTNANTTFSGTTGVTGAAGEIDRGGNANSTGFNLLKVSYRTAPGGTSSRNSTYGGRGVKVF